jgi:zinc protease
VSLPILALAVSLATGGIGRVLLPDGAELIVALLPEARTTAMVLVVRTGSADDPAEMAGLAHLLEHAIFEGSFDQPGRAFARAARAAGVAFNAHTGRELTTYELSAPASVFFEHASALMRLVTSPGLDRVSVDSVAAVVTTESMWRGGDRMSMLDDAIFDSPTRLLGTRTTLGRVKPANLVEFYTRWYRPANTTLVVAGPVTLPEVESWAVRASRLPPSLPEERPDPRVEPMTLPVDQRTRAPLTLVIRGYAVESADAAACRSLALVLERRLGTRRELAAEAAAAEVDCVRLRGNTLLLAELLAPRADAGSDLPELLTRLLAGLEHSPPTAAELRAITRHAELVTVRRSSRPAELALHIAQLATERTPSGRTDLQPLGPPAPLSPTQVRAFVRRNFQPERQIAIQLSPYEG